MQRTTRLAVCLLVAAMPLAGYGSPLVPPPSGNPTHPRVRHTAAPAKLAHTTGTTAAARSRGSARTLSNHTAKKSYGHLPNASGPGKYKEAFSVSHAAAAAERRHQALTAHAGSRGHLRAVTAAVRPAHESRLHAHAEPMAPIYIPPVPKAFRAALPHPVAPAPVMDPAEELLPAPTHDVLLSNAHTSLPPLPLDPALLLHGSHDSLLRQNERAQMDGLDRIQDDADIRRQVMAQTLVPLPEAVHLVTDPRLPENRRYTRPWTSRFLRDISAAFGMEFGEPLVITSAVRTVEFQRHLIHVNGNAAPPDGDAASPHLYGGVVDLGKHGMSARQLEWMRNYLRPLVAAGKIDVAEEFKQACFHISVYRSYVESALQQQQLARVAAARALPQAEAESR